VHELSICKALLEQVTCITADAGAQHVEHIVIEIGPLAGVEPGLIADAFVVMRRGGCAANASLSIESAAIRVACKDCNAVSNARANRLLCAVCGGYRTCVLAGEELRLLRVELRPPAVSHARN
jgi:hydrogenase nickel incorporation protein HypA/HybF